MSAPRNCVLVACVGNILRGDDGFGVAVARALESHRLPPGVDLVETGIGGMSIVQQLMEGYQGLIVVDAVDREAAPGTLFVLEPEVPEPGAMPTDEWRAQFSNLHLAEPSRVLLLAKSLGVLPARTFVVGCQVAACEEYEETLTPAVAAAVEPAAERVRALAGEIGGGHTPGSTMHVRETMPIGSGGRV